MRLTVYDIEGREVAVLVDESRKAGNHEVRFNSEGLASGIYFYRLHAGEFAAARKMILIE